MPYAAENRISQAPLESGIEITEAQYQQLLGDILSGKEIYLQNDEAFTREKAPSVEHTWDGSAWIAPEPEPEPEEPQLIALTARQIRLGLLGAGIPLSSIDTAIAAIPDATERAAAEISWEYATSYARDEPLIAAFASSPTLSLTDAQVDAMWLVAQEL